MGKMKQLDNQFKNNYHGVLDHTGTIKVAGYDVEQTVIKILKNEIVVRGVGKKYLCQIHKDLKDQIEFLSVGDTAFVKFRKGTAYIVGFQKTPKPDTEIVIEGDATLLEYFQQQKKLQNVCKGGLI